VLGAAFGVAVIVGNTIGVGILRTPGDIAARLPTPSLFLAVWIVGGLYALLGAISVAELGAMIPQSGGQYVFVRRALGGYAGFVVGWSDWISTAGSAAAIAMVIGGISGGAGTCRAGARPRGGGGGRVRLRGALLAGYPVGRPGPAAPESAQGARAGGARRRLERHGVLQR